VRALALAASLLAAATFARAGTATLLAYGDDGKALSAADLLAKISRADRRGRPALWGWSPDGVGSARPTISQRGDAVVLSWDGPRKLVLSLPWPIADDGFSTVLIDRDGRGISSGDTIRMSEEIALTQYRLFRDSLIKHEKDMEPRLEASAKLKKLAEKAKDSIADAETKTDDAKRARAFTDALHDISVASETMLVEHGRQIAADPRGRAALRFGLTLDATLLERLDQYKWIVDEVQRSGANWVRLVFRPNPSDFRYEEQRSFNEYDNIIKYIRSKGIHIMGCPLSTDQWPAELTPPVYAERVKRIVLHYRGQIDSWEVGNEVNGDWLGGRRSPLPPDDVVRIFAAGASAVKDIDPSFETVLTLFWWEGAAPDDVHSLRGWLQHYARRAFTKDIDVVALSLQVDDNPVGLSFERMFDRVRDAFPDKRLMLGNLGYVEGDQLTGYWWLDPKDVDGARKDLLTWLTPGACGVDHSLGGGFWWQTLDQLLPSSKRATDVYRVYRQSVHRLR